PSSHVSRQIHIFEFQPKCVDTTGHCVDTTDNCYRTGFWDSELVSTHRNKRRGNSNSLNSTHAQGNMIILRSIVQNTSTHINNQTNTLLFLT
ncbi:hypothetical protein Taro_041283, partial [Colocasia esculenta]|nr:hypothetical protein [Colocasia esculenta]